MKRLNFFPNEAQNENEANRRKQSDEKRCTFQEKSNNNVLHRLGNRTDSILNELDRYIYLSYRRVVENAKSDTQS